MTIQQIKISKHLTFNGGTNKQTQPPKKITPEFFQILRNKAHSQKEFGDIFIQKLYEPRQNDININTVKTIFKKANILTAKTLEQSDKNPLAIVYEIQKAFSFKNINLDNLLIYLYPHQDSHLTNEINIIKKSKKVKPRKILIKNQDLMLLMRKTYSHPEFIDAFKLVTNSSKLNQYDLNNFIKLMQEKQINIKGLRSKNKNCVINKVIKELEALHLDTFDVVKLFSYIKNKSSF